MLQTLSHSLLQVFVNHVLTICRSHNDNSSEEEYEDPAAEWGVCNAPPLPKELKVHLSRTASELVGPDALGDMPSGYYNFLHRVAKHFRLLIQRSNDPLHSKRTSMLKTAVYVV